MDHIFIELVSTATIAVAIFGASLCLVQSGHSSVRRSFAWFLGAVAVNNIPDAFGRLLAAWPGVYAQAADLIIWSPAGLCLAPLFWIYVSRLTSASQQRPAGAWRHFLLPAFAALVGFVIAVTPQDHGAAPALPGWSFALLMTNGLLQISLYPQMAVYLILIMRRMVRYRLLLRDFHASTERYELRWIYWIGGLAGVFWLTRAFVFAASLDMGRISPPPEALWIAGLASLGLVAAMTLWGVRQRPAFAPDGDGDGEREIDSDAPDSPKSEKYEKSALNAEASTRIARKLRAAMEDDLLYRDPNLSLWVLARRVGASPNYISQTLSEVIGESFFDFVNGYRIREAMTLLSDTEDTVLTITYDVGFNARSSFYNAFKRVTGLTPSAYRKSMSRPVGMDDHAA